jgi:hypothetical protein
MAGMPMFFKKITTISNHSYKKCKTIVRRHLPESYELEKAKASGQIDEAPFLSLFKPPALRRFTFSSEFLNFDPSLSRPPELAFS